MSDDGREVLADLTARAQRARERSDAAQQALRRADEEARDLLARRAETVLSLARHYLPDLERVEGATAFREVRAEIEAVQARREGRMRELSDRITAVQAQRAAAATAIEATTRALGQQVARRAELEAAAAERLQADPKFAAAAREAAEAEQALARDEQRAEELANEAREKLPAYEGSRLFTYLHRRGYGTPAYTAGGFARRMDRFVAAQIDYVRAREGYQFLQVTPRLVADEVERRRAAFTETMTIVERAEAAAAEAVGLPAVLAEGERLGAERDAAVERDAALQREHGELSRELTAIERSEGEFYRDALERLRTFLGSARAEILAAHARATPDATDDELVRQVRALDDALAGAVAEVERRTEQRSQAEATAVGLERAARRFRERNFDATRSEFDGLDVDDLVDEFERGRMDFDRFWSEIESHQRFRPQRTASIGARRDDDDERSGGGSDVSGILLQAMGHVLSGALRGAASRGISRRRSGGGLGGLGGILGGIGGGLSRGGGIGGGGGFSRGKGF